jgi:hypothetical protein
MHEAWTERDDNKQHRVDYFEAKRTLNVELEMDNDLNYNTNKLSFAHYNELKQKKI